MTLLALNNLNICFNHHRFNRLLKTSGDLKNNSASSKMLKNTINFGVCCFALAAFLVETLNIMQGNLSLVFGVIIIGF